MSDTPKPSKRRTYEGSKLVELFFALDDEQYTRSEVAAILHKMADRIERSPESDGIVTDSNARIVGRWEIR